MSLDKQRLATLEQYRINDKYCEPDSLFAGDVSLVSAMIFNPYYSLKDYYNTYIGINKYIDYDNLTTFCYFQCMQIGSFKGLSVFDRTDYKVPVYVIMGDKDYTVMTSVTKAYYEKINAPDKKYYEVEGGHYMPMLRSERLSEIIHEINANNT